MPPGPQGNSLSGSGAGICKLGLCGLAQTGMDCPFWGCCARKRLERQTFYGTALVLMFVSQYSFFGLCRRLWRKVTILQSHGHGRMAQKFPHRVQGRSSHDKMGSEGMPQVMDATMPDFRQFASPLKLPPDIVPAYGKHLSRFLGEALQHFPESGSHGDMPRRCPPSR